MSSQQVITTSEIQGQPRNFYEAIMSDNRKTDDSLDKELAYEDAVIAAGEESKRRREKAKEENEKAEEEERRAQEEERQAEEEERQAQMKEAMIKAGENSRTKRGKR
ncbi:hypothetical protein B0O99DRAFT_686983 [Bisporella sp. PMI_857]|nr:hypothetical protein B0O99DRAFT_686983 [Bisporella sp. PMI_857]